MYVSVCVQVYTYVCTIMVQHTYIYNTFKDGEEVFCANNIMVILIFKIIIFVC